MKRKIVSIGLLLLSMITFQLEAKEWKKIRIASEGAYPPFNETDSSGKMIGFDIEIGDALCTKMQANCRWVQQDWDGMIPGLMARKYDAVIASMSITEERQKRVAFTKKYYTSPARFIAKKGNFRAISNANLKGKKVGVQGTTVMDHYLTDNYGDIVKIQRYGTQQQANLDLISGRLDLVFGEVFSTDSGFLQTENGQNFEFIGPIFSDPQWFGEGIGIAIRKKNQDLVEQMNQALIAIRADGTYDQIQSKYFSYDIYGD